MITIYNVYLKGLDWKIYEFKYFELYFEYYDATKTVNIYKIKTIEND